MFHSLLSWLSYFPLWYSWLLFSLGLMKSEEATFSTSGVIWLFVHNPGYWFLLLFVFALPISQFLAGTKIHPAGD